MRAIYKGQTGDGRRATGDGRRATGDGRRATGDGRRAKILFDNARLRGKIKYLETIHQTIKGVVMPIATSSYALPGHKQCPDCNEWYEGTGVTVRERFNERTVCINCAELHGIPKCEECGVYTEVVDCDGTSYCEDCMEANGFKVCDSCGKGFDRLTDCDGDAWCDDCMEAADYHTCENCGDGFSELVDCGGNYYCEDCAHRKGWEECYHCHEWTNDSTSGADGRDYCDSCWCDHFGICEGCGDVFWLDDLNYHNDYRYCDSCAPSNEDFNPRGFKGSDSYTRMTSLRKFGVELETDECSDYMDLEGGRAWGAKDDGSVSGKEFYSDILYGDAGLDAINELCEFAGNHDWAVDRRCGYHAHFDMRNESVDSMKAIACAYLLTYEVWNKFVDSHRNSNYFCGKHTTSLDEIYGCNDWHSFCYGIHRYSWINFHAYYSHKTFEVRLHHGTLNGKEVCNWVRAHAAFMDWASKAGWNEVRNTLLCMSDGERFDFMARVWTDAGCGDLEYYYERKAIANKAGWLKESAYA